MTAPSKAHYADILVPTDFSEDAEHALERAQAMAETFGARLHLLHVREDGRPLVPRLDEPALAVVDDDPGLRTLLKTFLEKEGYGVLAIEGAGETRALAETSTINAFLVDIRLRGEDGLSLCRYIRNLPAHVHTPILCITAQEDSDVVQEAFKAGADDFIRKPISLPALVARLRVHMQKTEYFNKLERARQMLKRYLSPRVATLAEEYSELGVVPAPEERQVAICFTDIRGFTAKSEIMDPPDRKSTRLNSSHMSESRMPSSA